MPRIREFQNIVCNLYPRDEFPSFYDETKIDDEILCKNVTFVVTEQCNLNCSYCYETHKTKKRMTKEVAKKAVDMLFEESLKNDYIKEPFIILDFIGGEPLLEIDLIDYTVEYFKFKAASLDHIWVNNYMISITSNGTLYDNPKVQQFLNKNINRVSLNITIDGNKELHDSCRLFYDGRPSYDIVEKAVKKHVERIGGIGCTKLTLAPENITYLNDAIKNLYSLGISSINANCVFEEGWDYSHATILYEQMKELTDYIIDNDLEEDLYCSLFEDNLGEPLEENDNENWCFKAGTLVFTPDGNKRIEDLTTNDFVISHDNSIQKIEKILTRKSDDTAIIRATGMFETSTTLDHPYLVKKFKYIGNKNVYRYDEPQWLKVKDIKKGDKIALHCHKFGDIDFNKDIAYIVGRYIGDGWYSTTGYKLCCSYDEFDELKKAMDKANINYSVDNYKTVKQFNIFKNNIELIDVLSQIGHCAADKNIPKDAFKWNRESIKNLLKGLFDADGYFYEKKNMQKFNTISYVLASDLLLLLRGLGFYPTCYINKRAGKSMIEGREVNIKDRYEVYFNLDKSKSRYCKYDEERNVCWTTVQDIDTNCESYDVYNLTVENTHTFIANNAIVHNCGGTGKMVAVGTDGTLYPCLRYMKYSLSAEREPISFGHIDCGIGCNDKDKETIKCLKCITRRSQSTDECFNCPIARGCAWCSGYNYDKFGTPNKRATYICCMHKARVLANHYYYKKLLNEKNIKKDHHYELNVPKEEALKIISEKEYNMLLDL